MGYSPHSKRSNRFDSDRGSSQFNDHNNRFNNMRSQSDPRRRNQRISSRSSSRETDRTDKISNRSRLPPRESPHKRQNNSKKEFKSPSEPGHHDANTSDRPLRSEEHDRHEKGNQKDKRKAEEALKTESAPETPIKLNLQAHSQTHTKQPRVAIPPKVDYVARRAELAEIQLRHRNRINLGPILKFLIGPLQSIDLASPTEFTPAEINSIQDLIDRFDAYGTWSYMDMKLDQRRLVNLLHKLSIG